MKSSNELQVLTRKLTGKKVSRKLAKENRIPAVFYHKAEGNLNLEVEANVFQRFFNIERGIIDLVIDGGKEKKQVILKKVQFDPIKDMPIHIDFMGITKGQAIKTNVTIVLVGEAPGLKQGGFMEHSLRSLEIECLPKNLPDHVEVDVSQLNVGESFHVEDLELTDIKILVDTKEVICHIELPKVVEEVVVEEEEVVEETEPEVLKQKETEE
ncbi:MAG: 50S ribosomal protein L25 [Calditrichia bacterium]|nr:50S ribosomal protein L25 [Calditrichia bacterium]